MKMTRSELLEFIRSIHGRPRGTGALLNLIRASEVRAAADLSCLTEIISDERLRLDVTKHAADEARHTYILVRRMNEIGFAPSRLPLAVDRTEGIVTKCRGRDPKRVYADREFFDDEETFEILSAAAIAERDALPKLEANYEALTNDPQTQAVIGSILRDEHRHVAYLEDWVARFGTRVPSEFARETAERLAVGFEELNGLFYASFADYLRSAEAELAA
jgi:rubrerythrin